MSQKLTNAEITRRRGFALFVLKAVASLFYQRKPKILAKIRNKKEKIKIETLRAFLRNRPDIVDRIYGLTDNHDREATVQIIASSPELQGELVSDLFILPAPTPSPAQVVPSPTPSVVPSGAPSTLPQPSPTPSAEQPERSPARAESPASAMLRRLASDSPLVNVNAVPEQPRPIAPATVARQEAQEQRIESKERVDHALRMLAQGVGGDPNSDIVRESDLGLNESVYASSGSDISRQNSESSEYNSSTSDEEASRQNVGSQPYGLGLRADQIQRLVKNLKDDDKRKVVAELTGKGTINFNVLIDSLSAGAFRVLLASMVSPAFAPVFGRAISAALPAIRQALGADWNRYFTGDAVVPIVSNLSELRELNGTDELSAINEDNMINTRNAIAQAVREGRVTANVLERFDRISNLRYFITTGYDDPSDEDAPAVDEFIRREALTSEGLNVMLVSDRLRDATAEQRSRAMNRLLDDYEAVYADSLFLPDESPEQIRDASRFLQVPYFDLASRVRNNVNRDELFNTIQDAHILAVPNDRTAHLLNRWTQAQINDFSETYASAHNLREHPTVRALGLDAISGRRDTLRRVADAQSFRNALLGSAMLGTVGTIGASLYRGFSVGDTARMISEAAPDTLLNTFYTWATLKGLEAVTGLNLPAGQKAIAGAVAGLGTAVQSAISYTPVEVPPETQEVYQQEGSQAKGTLRPKFISPATSILDKTNNEIQSDFDQWSMFDFVVPTSEGADGNLANNPLKKSNYIQDQLNLQGGGTDIDVPLGMLDLPANSELKQLTLGYQMPEMKFQDAFIDENPFEVLPKIPGPLDIPDIKNPYNSMTQTIQMDEDIRRSVLYGWQP